MKIPQEELKKEFFQKDTTPPLKTQEKSTKPSVRPTQMKKNQNPIVLIDSDVMPNIEMESTSGIGEIERTLEVIDPTTSETPVTIEFVITKAEYAKLREIGRKINQLYENQKKPVDNYIMYKLEYAYHYLKHIAKEELDGNTLWLVSTKVIVRLKTKKEIGLDSESVFSGDEVKNLATIYGKQHVSVESQKKVIEDYMREQGIAETPELEITKLCQFCRKIPEKPLRCSECKIVIYCGATCQREDWLRHSIACQGKDVREQRLLFALGQVKSTIEQVVYDDPDMYKKIIGDYSQNGIPVLSIVLGGGWGIKPWRDPRTLEKTDELYMAEPKEYIEVYEIFKKIPNCLVLLITDPKATITNEDGSKKLSLMTDFVSLGMKNVPILKNPSLKPGVPPKKFTSPFNSSKPTKGPTPPKQRDPSTDKKSKK
jgi:hypothetical protein